MFMSPLRPCDGSISRLIPHGDRAERIIGQVRRIILAAMFYLLLYNTDCFLENKPTFRRNMFQETNVKRGVFLPVLFVNPEDGGAMYLRNAGWFSTDYTQ
jgi:hypothetical protein